MRSILILAVLLAGTTPAWVAAQSASREHAEAAFDYTWLHSNAPPGGCGCFSSNGGSATIAVPLSRTPILFVADFTFTTASSTTPGFYGSLQLSTYTAGIRYAPHFHGKPRFRPFAQAEAGVAHAGGSLAKAPYTASANAAATFAGNIGGGLDLHLARHVGFRLVEAQYLLTTFDNNSNTNRQNNARVSTGLLLYF